MQHVDVAIIGAGTAGLAAFRSARAHTESVVLIEGGPFGTTCARVGCMPSKLLIAAAEAAHTAGHAHRFGVRADPVVDGVAVMNRVRSERDRFVGFVVRSTEQKLADGHIVRGYATFVDDNTLRVNDQLIRAKAIVIATGSRARALPFAGALGDRMITNDGVFDWTGLPASIVVVGAGVIGLELGQSLHRLGVRVRVFGRGGALGPLSDPDVRASLDRALDVYVDADATVHSYSRDGDEVVVDFVHRDGRRLTERFELALSAAGRVPNVDKLGLENTSLALDKMGVPVFDRHTMRAGTSNIFIAGDVNNDLPLLHEAADEGRNAGANAATFPELHARQRRSSLGVVFSSPQIAMVGQSLASLADEDVVVGEVSFDDQGRSRVMGVNAGLLHVYADRMTGRFLGAEMVGPAAEHIGHLLAWSHQGGLTVANMLDNVFYHPVIEEGLRTALRDAQRQIVEAQRIHHLTSDPVSGVCIPESTRSHHA